MDCPQGIPPSGTPAHHHRSHRLNIDTPIDPPHATIMKTGTNAVDPDHNHIIKDNTTNITITPTEAVLGHSIGTVDDITGVLHDAHTQYLYPLFLP